MKYFVTGATGFVGGSLVKQLKAAGHDVVAIVRSPEKAGHLHKLGITLVKGDVTDKESMRQAMTGVDGVYHVAGWYKVGVRDKAPGHQINVQGTRNVLELMRELAIPKGVYTSTLAVNSDTKGQEPNEDFHFTGTHISEYDKTKAEAHEIALEFIAEGLPLVVVMPGLIYGPDGTSLSDEALRLFLQGKLPMIPSQSAYVWAHVDDIAQAHILGMEKAKPGSKYIIGGPSHTFSDAMSIASKLTGKRKPMVVPPFMLRMTGFFTSLVAPFFDLPEMYHPEALRVQAGVTYLGDNSRAKRDLGYNPRPLEQGLQETFAHELQKM